MKMPGFNADSSLDSEHGYYQGSLIHVFAASSVVPQAKALAKCNARCLGAYFGSAGACFGTSNSDLCFAAAGNRYNRCGEMCDLLYG